jgi:hypothetical protein
MKNFASLLCASALPLAGLTGCDRDQEVMEIETPRSEVEVERDADTGALQVDD